MDSLSESERNTKQMVPAWAMKLIADAQVPNGRWLHFKPNVTLKEVIDWCIESALRIVVAKTFMEMFAENQIGR